MRRYRMPRRQPAKTTGRRFRMAQLANADCAIRVRMGVLGTGYAAACPTIGGSWTPIARHPTSTADRHARRPITAWSSSAACTAAGRRLSPDVWQRTLP